VATAQRPSRKTPAVQSGSDPRTKFPPILAAGRRLAPHEDFYHWVLTLTWPRFFGAAAGSFVVLNTAFAALFAAAPGSVKDAHGFLDLFFFSVETLATIGYGEMSPQSHYGHALVVTEAFVGIMFSAVVTGLTFARFARPQARILFSEKLVVTPRNGVPHLMMRVANWRRNQIIDAQLTMLVLVTETTTEGDTMRRPLALKLVREKNPMFALSWTVMHEIDEDSPFHGPEGMAKLRAMGADIFVTLYGLDETLMQTVVARYRYSLDDIAFDAKFADLLTVHDDGTRVIDYDQFHDVEPLREPKS
jgi:inward rectifier potassium channel